MRRLITRVFGRGVYVLIRCLVWLSGCSIFHNTAIGGPSTPKALQTDGKRDTDVLNEVTNYYYNRCPEDTSNLPSPATPASSRPTNCGSAEEQRNTIIYDLKSIIDNNYVTYARRFQQTADAVTFGGEVGAAALTAVGTLVGTSDLKDILWGCPLE